MKLTLLKRWTISIEIHRDVSKYVGCFHELSPICLEASTACSKVLQISLEKLPICLEIFSVCIAYWYGYVSEYCKCIPKYRRYFWSELVFFKRRFWYFLIKKLFYINMLQSTKSFWKTLRHLYNSKIVLKILSSEMNQTENRFIR